MPKYLFESKFVTYLLSKLEQMPIFFQVFFFPENSLLAFFPLFKREMKLQNESILEFETNMGFRMRHYLKKKTNMVLFTFVQCRKYRHLYRSHLKPPVRNLILKQLLHKKYLGFPHQWIVANAKITEIVFGHLPKTFYLQQL